MTAKHMRLGRVAEHDPASLAFPAAAAPGPPRSAEHRRRGGALSQGALGSCTGNAMAGLLMTEPYWQRGRTLTEKDAVALYGAATRLDGVPGSYPPDDTGSSGLAVMKAAKAAGYVAAYHHAFGLQHALGALQLAPVITGVDWYDSFDRPDAGGLVSIAPGASVRGGHEFEVAAIDAGRRLVGCWNSWGRSWGLNGFFWMAWDTWDRLLRQRGDVTVAVA